MTREEAIEQFKYAIDLIKQDGKDYLDERDIPMLKMGIEALENQKTGHWEEEEMYDGDVAYRCSECGEVFCLMSGTPIDNLYNYCPNCGARLESEE